MERLTSNKPVSEMGMYELAHNSCYIKDGKVRVRDFENDSDAREFIRKIFENIADDTFIDDTDEIFDEVITDYLQYGTSNLVGLIAVFYRNLCATANLRERLKKYEDLEEQGKLPRLPCAVGDGLYVLTKDRPTGIEETKCQSIVLSSETKFIIYAPCQHDDWGSTNWKFEIADFGKKVFLSKEKAEAALKNQNNKRYRRQGT